MTAISDIEFSAMDGTTRTLGDHAGEVVLVVNVASACGLTPQYTALQALYTEKAGEGFTIVAFPANDFGGQEPGTDAEIAEFCSSQYSVTFPVMSKIVATGDDRHPLYSALIAEIPETDGKAEMRERLKGFDMNPTDDPEVLWNFEKFVIGRDGRVVARFAPPVTPDDPAVVEVIEAELAK
ncbi:MAG: glutathione peroxidase [Actinobacteria bacterium]|nr:glutathione peroxidase [Actinomycetota bacterium]